MNIYFKYLRIDRKLPHSRQAADKRVNNDIRFDGLYHWPTKGKQRRCGMQTCKGTTLFMCEKCDVALHPECFKSFHIPS